MPLFLFNYSTGRLYGIFEAASDGGFNLDPYAWGTSDLSRSARSSNPVSRYPAQVRVRTRAWRPPLDEDTFRRILDQPECQKFRLELTTHQVQLLLHLFGEAGSPEEDVTDERNVNDFVHTDIGTQDPESPRSAFKSDSDCYSECSSRGTNFGEDEWTDEAPNENGMARESMQMCYSDENDEGSLRDRLSHVNLDDLRMNESGPIQNQLDKEMLYNAAMVSRLRAASEDSGSSASDGNGQQMVCKGNPRKAAHRQRIGTFQPVIDNPILLRLHESDPAVNSTSMNCIQTSVHQPLTVKRQDNAVKMPMIPPQVQTSFPAGENIIYIPVQTVHCQQRALPSFSAQLQRSKWNDQRKFSHSSSTNSRKKVSSQDKINKPKDVKYHKQHLVADNQQPPSAQAQRFQIGKVLVPLCAHRSGPLHEQGRSASLLPPALVTQHDQALTFTQRKMDAGMDDSGEGYEIQNDGQLHPNGFQNVLQNGHPTIVLMPSFVPRVPATPSPMSGFVEELHLDILNFARLTRPSAETQLHAEAAIDCVRKGVQMVWPEADVEVFGSFATGLCLQHSDVDLAVVGAPLLPSLESLSLAQASAFLIRELASALEEYEWCESINVLDTASMPVLKCHCRPFVELMDSHMSTPSIAIDITIGGIRSSDSVQNLPSTFMDSPDQVSSIGKFGTRHTGGTAREYVLQRIWDLPALAPLVLLLKSFLHHKGLSNVYSGGLGSFSLTLLLAFYLERVPISREMFSDGISGDSPLSPTASSPVSCLSEFSEDSDRPHSSNSYSGVNLGNAKDFTNCSLGKHYVRRAADVMERVLTLWDSGGSPYLGILLLGFLQTFGFVLDLSSEKIVLKGIDGSPGGIFKRNNRHVALWIDDPLRPGVNVGAGSFGMFHVQEAFREMLLVLTNQKLFASPPCCNEEGCQDLAAMSQLYRLSRLTVEDGYE